jgi:hypothetical protein
MPSDTLGERVRAQGEYLLFADKLDPFNRVAAVLQPQHPHSSDPHLDVIVQIPTSSKWQDIVPAPQRSSGNISMLPWLVELHSKIWHRVDRKPELFREVLVTQAHYDELQRRLNEQHSDRSSRGYNGRHIVQRVKLDVLGMDFPANSPQRPNAPEASGNDESRMDVDEPAPNNDGGSTTTDTIFPFTLNFLDLSSLELTTDGSNRLPPLLLLRQEYQDISVLINNGHVDGYNSWIISGQPGTGEALVSVSHRI